MNNFRFLLSHIFILLIVFNSICYAESSREALDKITARGKLLAEYDAASWTATDVMRSSSKIDPALVQRYIARKIGKEWEVVFGQFNPKKDAFIVNYKYLNNLDSAKKQKVPYEDTDYYYHAAIAIEKAIDAFNQTNTYQRPFNVAVLPIDDNFYVYIYPAVLKKDVYPLGGDWRYLVSGKTFKILETRQLHKVIFEPELPTPGGVESGFHIAVLDDIPEDTDVFYVLTRRPSAVELIATKNYVYKINKDGEIAYLGLAQDIFGK